MKIIYIRSWKIISVSIIFWWLQFTYSGVTSDPVDATMITNTIIVVLFSTLVSGHISQIKNQNLVTTSLDAAFFMMKKNSWS